MSQFLGIPPLPTDQGPLPAPDVTASNSFNVSTNTTDSINATKANLSDLQKIMEALDFVQKDFSAIFWWVGKHLVEAWVAMLKFGVVEEGSWANLVAQLHEETIKVAVPAANSIVADNMALVLEAMSLSGEDQYAFPQAQLSDTMTNLFGNLILPFTLLTKQMDLRSEGQGIANVTYLLHQAMTLSMAEYTMDAISNLTGFGWVKSVLPLLGFIDRSINPSNIVRQAMEQGYSFLVKAPMQRDLNRKHPIRDLGLTVLAKLYIRGAIDETTFLSKCLDAGLDNTQAQQLVIESRKWLSEAQIAKLLTTGFITEDDAREQLTFLGYEGSTADALIYLQTHERYFSIQERVGNEAVTAWKKGIIGQAQLESLLQNLGFTPDEIALLEIEGQFVKGLMGKPPVAEVPESLSVSQVKAMFEHNIVDLNFVIQFLTNYGYAPEDVTRLVLLEFVSAEERSLHQAELAARIRVQAEAERQAAAVELNRNETALATARQALAGELDTVQKQLGLLESLPSIMGLLGISL